MKFIRNTSTKIVSDSGAIILLRPWKVSRTSPSTKPTMISTRVWNLPGTPAVALRAVVMKKNRNSRDSTAVKNSVSTFNVMNWLSPTLTCRWCRWWLMYSVEPPDSGAPLAFSAITRSTLAVYVLLQEIQCHQVGQRSRHQPGQQRQRRQPPHRERGREYRDRDQPLAHRTQQQPAECDRCRDDATQRHEGGKRIAQHQCEPPHPHCQCLLRAAREESRCQQRDDQSLDGHRAQRCPATGGDGIVHANHLFSFAGSAEEGRTTCLCKSLLRSRRSIAGAGIGRQPPEALIFRGLGGHPGPPPAARRGTFRGPGGLSLQACDPFLVGSAA